MIKFILFFDSLLRGKDYFTDFLKTIIIGFIFYISGFVVILIKILAFSLKGIEGQGIAIIYYVILMPIVMIPIMSVYFSLLVVLRFFFPQKN